MKRLLCAVMLCTATIAGVAPASAQVSGGVNIRIGPPAPIVERIPAAPGPNYFWRAGWWRWSGNAYVWAPGAYVVRPYAGARWIAGHWVQRPRGWVWRPGHWS
jgi:hypothetical protein